MSSPLPRHLGDLPHGPIIDAWVANAKLAGEAGPKSARQKLLEEAIAITTQDRNKAYGNPEDNFRNIADLWAAYFSAQGQRVAVTAADVAVMMILMKAARLATNLDHRDSAVDIAGYAGCLADIQETRAANKFRNELVNKPHQDIEGVKFPE